MLKRAKECDTHDKVLDLLERIKNDINLCQKILFKHENNPDYADTGHHPHVKSNRVLAAIDFMAGTHLVKKPVKKQPLVGASSGGLHFDNIHEIIGFVQKRKHDIEHSQEGKSTWLPEFLKRR